MLPFGEPKLGHMLSDLMTSVGHVVDILANTAMAQFTSAVPG